MRIQGLRVGCLVLALGFSLPSPPFIQDAADKSALHQVCIGSVRGVYASGVVSDRGLSEFYNVRLDFEGTGLRDVPNTHLLSGYSVEGVDNKGVNHSGEVRVSEVYAWSEGDYHDWIAYFRISGLVKKLTLKRGGRIVGTLDVATKFGDGEKFRLFEVNEGRIRWHADLNGAELAVSTDGGASWFSSKRLRSSLNTTGVDPVESGFSGEVLVSIQGYEKGAVYLDCLKYRRN